MDPFTQRMLERAKMRREKLENHLTHAQEQPSHFNSAGKICVINKNYSDIKLDLKSTNDIQGLTGLGKIKLQKLAQLYSEKSENLNLSKEIPEEGEIYDLSKKHQYKSNKLAALTAKISQWEEENKHLKPLVSTGEKVYKNVNSENVKQFGEKKDLLIWNPSMLEKLCSQGFSLSEEQSKLIYDFKKTQEESKLIHLQTKDFVCHLPSYFQRENNKTKTSDELNQNSKSLITNKVDLQKSSNTTESNIREKDPTELSLAERRALFEKNFNADSKLKPSSKNLKTTNFCLNTEKTSKISKIHTCFFNQKENYAMKKNDLSFYEKQKLNLSNNNYDQNFCVNTNVSFEKNEDNQIKKREIEKEKYLNHDQLSSSESSITPLVVNNEQNDLKLIKNLDNSNVSVLPNGKLYPSLDNLQTDDFFDFDSLQSETLTKSKNYDFRCGNTPKNSSVTNCNNPITLPNDNSFSKSKEFQVLNRMDNILESALNNIASKDENILEVNLPSPPKILKNSSSDFNTKKTTCPLLHTISFYRKQQQINFKVQDELDENDEQLLTFKKNQDDLVEDKIQFLVTEVNKQQSIMSQASQALNLCLSTVEFSNSGEQVEGERLLLLASHKRQACLNEIQRLKIEKCLQSVEKKNFEKGDVKLENINIKLKRDALRAMAVAESLQYFVCLIKSEERVLATPVVPAIRENLKDLNLQFPGILKLEGLLSDFKVSIEVYNLELNKEILPHDIKYHIVNKKDKKLLTPIKSKKSECKLIKPQIQSPAGPNAIRTSNFQMCGYIVFSLKEINRTQWTLNKVPYMSSLEGSISMTIHSQLHLDDEHRGFLTMFEDISGFGAWHRRWCLLSSYILSFWKYPDDEQKKIPIGSIDLRSVTTENVSLVSRDICARLHTFLLETRRPRLHEDRNSLVLSVEDNVTIIRQLLSADSKKDMILWCKKINATLALLRSWKCNSD